MIWPFKKTEEGADRCPKVDRRKQQRRFRARRRMGQPRWHDRERRHSDRRKA